MPIPVMKAGIVAVKFFAKPFNNVLKRRLKARPETSEEKFFVWFGKHCYSFELIVDRMIQGQEKELVVEQSKE